MTELADRFDCSSYTGAKVSRTRYAPFANDQQPEDQIKPRSGSGISVLIMFLALSGLTVAFSRGQAVIVETYGISQETVLGVAWILQGMVALACFVLVVRWLRS